MKTIPIGTVWFQGGKTKGYIQYKDVKRHQFKKLRWEMLCMFLWCLYDNRNDPGNLLEESNDTREREGKS